MSMPALHRLWTDEDGVTTVEYALLLALVVVASIGAWGQFRVTLVRAINVTATAWTD